MEKESTVKRQNIIFQIIFLRRYVNDFKLHEVMLVKRAKLSIEYSLILSYTFSAVDYIKLTLNPASASFSTGTPHCGKVVPYDDNLLL